MSEDKIICNCMDIYENEIIDAIKTQGLKTVEEVQDATSAGTGCGGCVELIEEILEKTNK